jgi:hypothetical protein
MNKAKVEPKACRESCVTQRFRRRSTCTHRKRATRRELRRGKTELLVVAHRVEATWKTSTLQTTGGDAPVVGVKTGEYKDVYGEQSIRATGPVIIFCRYEAWAIFMGRRMVG